jgi:S1-C subfamily serine protease
MVVEAPAQKPIAFVAEAVNALRVVITDTAGRLAKAGLKSGDFVVAIDGREFSKREELDRIRLSLAAEEVTLTIQRAGERFEVVVPRTFLNDEKAAGGRFRESSR